MATKLEEDFLQGVTFIKQLGGTEDLIFGFGTVMQIRSGQSITISAINAETIPYTTTDTVKSIIDQILTKYPL